MDRTYVIGMTIQADKCFCIFPERKCHKYFVYGEPRSWVSLLQNDPQNYMKCAANLLGLLNRSSIAVETNTIHNTTAKKILQKQAILIICRIFVNLNMYWYSHSINRISIERTRFLGLAHFTLDANFISDTSICREIFQVVVQRK